MPTGREMHHRLERVDARTPKLRGDGSLPQGHGRASQRNAAYCPRYVPRTQRPLIRIRGLGRFGRRTTEAPIAPPDLEAVVAVAVFLERRFRLLEQVFVGAVIERLAARRYRCLSAVGACGSAKRPSKARRSFRRVAGQFARVLPFGTADPRLVGPTSDFKWLTEGFQELTLQSEPTAVTL
jgi:hypothetical protein